jgi:hypothetical protein
MMSRDEYGVHFFVTLSPQLSIQSEARATHQDAALR